MKRLALRPAGWGVLAALMLLANVPRLLVPALLARPGQVFVGEFWNSFDLPQYVEAIHEGSTGRWLYGGRLWGATVDGNYPFQVEYLAVGHLLAGWNSLAVLEVMRWGCQIFAVCSALLLICAVFRDSNERAWALFFGTIAGGLGWLALGWPSTPLGQVIPMDVVTPSFNLLDAFIGSPHLALMGGCMAVYGWGFVEATRGHRKGLAGLAGLALALDIHPFEIVAIVSAAALIAVLMVRTPTALAFVGASLLLSGLVAGYLVWLAGHDSIFAALTASSLTTEVGNVPSFLVARGPVVVPAVAALWVARRHLDPVIAFLAAWAGLATVLNLQPFDPAGALHRSLEGASLAFGCLAALGMHSISIRWRPLLAGICLVSPMFQVVALLMTVGGEPVDWVPTAVFQLASEPATQRTNGCVSGDVIDIRWLAAESNLCLANAGQADFKLVLSRGRATLKRAG